jgi:hypothetical protein
MPDQVTVVIQTVIQGAQQLWGWLGFTPATVIAIIAIIVAVWAAERSRRTSLEVASLSRETQRELAREGERRAERRAEVERSLTPARQRPGKYRTMVLSLGGSDLTIFRRLHSDLGPALGQDDPHLITRSGRYGRAFGAFALIDNEAAKLVLAFNEAPSRDTSPASRLQGLAVELHDFLEVLERTAQEYVEQVGLPPEVVASDDRRIEEILNRYPPTSGPVATGQ